MRCSSRHSATGDVAATAPGVPALDPDPRSRGAHEAAGFEGDANIAGTRLAISPEHSGTDALERLAVGTVAPYGQGRTDDRAPAPPRARLYGKQTDL